MVSRAQARLAALTIWREREFELFVQDNQAALDGKPLPLCADHHAVEWFEINRIRRYLQWRTA